MPCWRRPGRRPRCAGAAFGVPAAAGLTTLYLAAFGGSHPLAKKIGAWPAVLTVTGVVAAASALATGD